MSEPDVSNLLTVAEAIAIIDATPVSPRMGEFALHEADGLVLAEDVRADRDYPPFDKSLMDGFAVRCADASDAGAMLTVVGDIPAGRQATRALAPGEAMSIMTGAPLPAGADGVVPIEDVEHLTPSPRYAGESFRQGERGERPASAIDARVPALLAPLPNPLPEYGERESQRIRISRAAVPGRYISRRGSDARAGQVVLDSGTSLGPAQLAVAASVGAAKVKALAKPRVAVLATGDELIAVDQTPGPAQIRNSNNLMLVSLLRKHGCDVTDLGVVRDEPTLIREALARAIESADVLFVTGGMSMGAYDYVPRTLIDLGVELKITKLRIKPGKPFVFGQRGEKFVFGLPGNPVSAFVCTVRLASRLTTRLGGHEIVERWVDATLTEPLDPNGPREFYLPAVLSPGGEIMPLKWKGSADIYTLAKANALLPRAENAPSEPAGATVRVLEV